MSPHATVPPFVEGVMYRREKTDEDDDDENTRLQATLKYCEMLERLGEGEFPTCRALANAAKISVGYANQIMSSVGTIAANEQDDNNESTLFGMHSMTNTSMSCTSIVTSSAAQKRQELFQVFRDEFTQRLPANHVAQWGQIAYGNFGPRKYYYPILILDPFQTPPQPIRSRWFELYQKVRKQTTSLIFGRLFLLLLI